MLDRWNHQLRGVGETQAAIDAGERAICLTSPTGGGKTRMVTDLLDWASRHSWPSVLYTNRRLLLEQLVGDLRGAGIDHGVRASGSDDAIHRLVQLATMQTEASRTRSKTRELHPAKLVIVDECHNQANGEAERIINEHKAAGAAIVGVTATPLGVGHLYDKLIVAGTNSELRRCGALVPCDTFGPDEPDTRHIKKIAIGMDPSEAENRKLIMVHGVFGRVFEHWNRLNPSHRPTILFAPGVKEAQWFAEQFNANGVRAASIDGENVWIDGESHPSTKELREQVISGVRDGSIKLLCNRFVCREGINIPELYCCITATVFGSLVSWLQSVGRLLRSHPSLDRVVWIDHGGNWWRFGSPNADREWALNLDERQIMAQRFDAMRAKSEPQPITCPKCHQIRLSGPVCRCGFRYEGTARMVVQHDGKLRQMTGDIFKERKVKQEADTESLWKACYFACKNARIPKTFTNVRGIFYKRHGYWPPPGLPLMPKNAADWHNYVKKVPFSDLHSGGWGAAPKPPADPQSKLFEE